jgi:hypothetical protein
MDLRRLRGFWSKRVLRMNRTNTPQRDILIERMNQHPVPASGPGEDRAAPELRALA